MGTADTRARSTSRSFDEPADPAPPLECCDTTVPAPTLECRSTAADVHTSSTSRNYDNPTTTAPQGRCVTAVVARAISSSRTVSHYSTSCQRFEHNLAPMHWFFTTTLAIRAISLARQLPLLSSLWGASHRCIVDWLPSEPQTLEQHMQIVAARHR